MSSKYEFIDGEKANYPIVLMCRWALVSRSGFYEWSGRPASATAQRRGALAVRVREVFEFSDSTYGYRRVHEELARRGVEIGPELVRQLMAEMDLVTWEGWLYLATVIDLHTKEVCGWAMADHMRTGLVCEALTMAHTHRPIDAGAVFHSDRGCQYTSSEFAAHLKSLQMVGSMGRVGVCWDNALAESFFASLKKELTHRTVYSTRKKARDAVAYYIEVWYNTLRLHSGLGYRTPLEAFEQYQTAEAA